MKPGKHKNTIQKTWCLHHDDGRRTLLEKSVCTIRGQWLSYHTQQNKQVQLLPTTPMSAPIAHTTHHIATHWSHRNLHSFHCYDTNTQYGHTIIPTPKVNDKAVPVHAMKAYRGSEGRALLILNLGTAQRWVVSLMPQTLYPQQKHPGYPMHRRLGGPQIWTFCRREISCPSHNLNPRLSCPWSSHYNDMQPASLHPYII